MPIYEYRCEDCGHRFEKLVFTNKDADPRCPECDSARVDKLMSAGSVRPRGIPKGSGGFKAPACTRSGR
jgi:putative FmdB family regulatory protein